MKILKNVAMVLFILLSICSCTNNSEKQHDDLNDNIAVTEKNNGQIKNGKYYLQGEQRCIELTEGKYIQLINWTEDEIEELRKFYVEASYTMTLYDNEIKGQPPYSEEQANDLRRTLESSTQLTSELVNRKSECAVNINNRMETDTNTDTEIAYYLSDYKLSFSYLYYYKDNNYRLESWDHTEVYILSEE